VTGPNYGQVLAKNVRLDRLENQRKNISEGRVLSLVCMKTPESENSGKGKSFTGGIG
jgi:hypothetical protein